ncbi:hypothetical protein [Taibaiella koreensis]|uniref:hypothetical protein n=1 Tax=Taibaiella koreensis TaxID=1268548 RepID=UPI0013C2E78F|nr:hypothetical protein [Taibaiella koreensis]
MNRKYRFIAGLKNGDAVIQALCFLFMIGCFFLSSEFAMHRNAVLIMAGFQVFSAVFWLFVLITEPAKTRGGRFIRVLFILVPLLLALIVSTYSVAILIAAYAMIIVGPVLGFSYFFITVAEVSFYRRLGNREEDAARRASITGK